MMAHPFRNKHQSCQRIEENATLFMSEHTLFACDLQWMPKDCKFAAKTDTKGETSKLASENARNSLGIPLLPNWENRKIFGGNRLLRS